MSKIEELLKDEKVEWKKLEEICEIVTDYVAAGSFKSIASNVKYLNKPDYAQLVRTKDIKSRFKNKNSFVYVNKKAFDYLYRVNLDKECLILPNIGNCGEIYHVLPEDLPYENNVLGPNAILLRSKNPSMKFLYYLLQESYFQSELYKITSKTGQGKFNKTDLKQIRIPIPSIEVQEKIVKKLDNFTNYVTELQAELQARTKQYEYYRDMLLSEEYLNTNTLNVISKSDKNYQIYKLNKIADIERGKRVVRNDLNDNGKYAVYQNSLKPLGYYDYKNFEGNKTFVISAGAAGEIFYTEEDFWAADDVFVITTHGEVLNKYIYYFLQNKQEDIKSRVRKASIPRLSREAIEKLDILFPNKAVQKQIVEILDRFQNLIVETEGLLPKEIELRQKQYEYYREKLLDFKK